MMNEARRNGYNSVTELTRALKYNSTEKLYRLKRSSDNKPSFTIIKDLTNLFEFIDLKYLITGERAHYKALEKLNNAEEEVSSIYKTQVELLKDLFGNDNEDINKKIDAILSNQKKILDRLDKGIHLDALKNKQGNGETNKNNS